MEIIEKLTQEMVAKEDKAIRMALECAQEHGVIVRRTGNPVTFNPLTSTVTFQISDIWEDPRVPFGSVRYVDGFDIIPEQF